MGEYSALKEAIDISMRKIKLAKNAIKDAINTAGEPMGVSVDDTDTFRYYATAIRSMYQRIWSSDDGTDAPEKCIITNKDFPAAPMHNYGYIDINDLSASRFRDENKYFAASSFIVDIQNPPVPILGQNHLFFEAADLVSTIQPTVDPSSFPDVLDSNHFPALTTLIDYSNTRNDYLTLFHNIFVSENGAITVDPYANFGENKIYISRSPEYWSEGATFVLKEHDETFTFIKRVALASYPTGFDYALYERLTGGD